MTALRRGGLVLIVVGTLTGIGVQPALAVTSGGRTCTVVGTAGNDRLVGGGANDVICGLGGNDVIYGGGGADWVDGGYGADVLRGGAGADVLNGGPDIDTVYYDDHTGPVVVVLDGVANDGAANERDRLATVENVHGGRGADTLIGDSGANVLAGEGGNDVVDGRYGPDRLYGGSGYDAVAYLSRTSSVLVSLDNRYGDGQPNEQDNVYSDVEAAFGGFGNDRIVGSAAANELYGGPGDDLLQGLGGADYLAGGAGVDTVTYTERSVPVTAVLDGLVNDGAAGEGDGIETDVENLVGGSAADSLVGDEGPNLLDARAGDDELLGLGGNDVLEAGAGNDLLIAGSGADIARGGLGTDDVQGGAGRDRLAGDAGPDTVDGGADPDICTRDAEGDPLTCEVALVTPSSDLESLHLLTVTVLDSEGAPSVGAEVNGTVVGPDGLAYTVGWSIAGSLQVEAPLGGTRTARFWTPFSTPTDRALTLTLPVKRPVTVEVEDALGDPIEGALVSGAYDSAPGGKASLDASMPLWSVSESALGYGPAPFSFSTYVTQLGAIVVSAPHDPVVGTVWTTATETVPAGGVITRVLEIRPSRLSAVVRTPADSVIQGVAAGWNGPEPDFFTAQATADGTGAVVLDLPRQSGYLTLTVPLVSGATPGLQLGGQLDMRAGDRSLDMKLPTPQAVTVHVLDHTGTPLAGAAVTGTAPVALSQPLALTGSQLLGGTTDAQGTAVLPWYTSATRTLKVVWGSSATGKHAATTTASGTDVTIIVDTRSVAIGGRVLTAADDTPAGVVVGVDTDGVENTGTTSSGGSFSLRTSPGSGTLSLSGTGLADLPWSFRVAGPFTAGSDRQVVTSLSSARLVTVHVHGPGAVDVSGAELTTDAGTAFAYVAGIGTVSGTQDPLGSPIVTDSKGSAVLTAFRGSFTLHAVLGGRSQTVTAEVADSDTDVYVYLPA